MHIRAFFSQNDVIVDVRASDKVQLLKDLSARAALEVALDPALVSAEILKREELGSTGLGSGVAIPHARILGLGKLYGSFARLKRALDFAAVDGEPVDLVFLLLLPSSTGREQLEALAAVARQLRKPTIAAMLRKARDGSEAYNAMLSS
jgi:PTS system nitrogen regulatory IIA component